MLWDIFISHASEDKSEVARPLQQYLEKAGLRVWLDETQLKVGDSLREKIDEGLAQSRFGIVILSPAFFAKQWPQRELNGLFARETGDRTTIIPVWHNLAQQEVARFSPMLADRVAVLTTVGWEQVVRRILEVAGQHLDITKHTIEGRYRPDFRFPTEYLNRSIRVIESLGAQQTWKHLAVTNDDYPYYSWIGTDSSSLIEALYDLMAPLVEFHQLKYAFKRSLYAFGPSARLHYGLLEAAMQMLWSDSELASAPPAISYTPRVEGWREKRKQNPQRYWWQGVERERFDAAVNFFLKPESISDTTVGLRSVQEFRSVYRNVHRSGDRKNQQTLGLLANALYGFTPKTRPVFWRLLICWARIYQAVLGNTSFDPESMRPEDAINVLTPHDWSRFPYSFNQHQTNFFEPHQVTLEATAHYVERFVAPRLEQYLRIERE